MLHPVYAQVYNLDVSRYNWAHCAFETGPSTDSRENLKVIKLFFDELPYSELNHGRVSRPSLRSLKNGRTYAD